MLTPDMGKSGIYSITNTVNGHRYVGSAVNLAVRWGKHRTLLRSGAHHSLHLQRAWNKYGEAAFEFEVLDEWGPEFLISQEQWWINMLRPEYNSSKVAGSVAGMRFGPPSAETRAKISAANTGKKRTEEARTKMSAQRSGRVLGPHSKETRAKIAAARMGILPSAETRAKMSMAQQGRSHSAETRAKIAASKTGKRRGEFSESWRANMSASRKRYYANKRKEAEGNG